MQSAKLKKLKKIYNAVLAAVYSAALLICVICNLAIDHTLTWSLVVITALAMCFSLTTVPVISKNHKGMKTLACFYLSLNLLFIVCKLLYNGGDWYIITTVSVLLAFSLIFLPFVLYQIKLPRCVSNHKTLIYFIFNTVILLLLITVTVAIESSPATLMRPDVFPAALVLLALPWALMIIIRYIKVNPFFKSGICSLFTGGYVLTINGILLCLTEQTPFKIMPVDLTDWNSAEYISGNVLFITFCTLALIGTAFIIGGIIVSLKNKIK